MNEKKDDHVMRVVLRVETAIVVIALCTAVIILGGYLFKGVIKAVLGS